MKLDFEEIKRIPITQVVWKYRLKITVVRGGDGKQYGKAPCPLPTHKANDRAQNFSLDITGNYWRCWSGSCNEAAKCKGGDVISFVALMDGIKPLDAATKLSEWFNVGKEMAAPRKEARPDGKGKQPPSHLIPESTSSAVAVKYTEKVRIWFEELSQLREGETDEEYRKRVLRGVTSELLKNYQAGKSARAL